MIGKHDRRGRLHRCVTGALTMFAVAALSACGTSSGGGPSSPPPSTTAAPSTGGPGSPADAATTSAVKNAYHTLFAPSTPLRESIAVLQDGTSFKEALIEQGKSPMAKKSSAAVSKVTLLSPDLAQVTYSVLLAGTPVLPGQTGYAVREDGAWKVADKTFCGLLALDGSTPAACKRPGATTLPGAG
jgi:hypothetical protein